MSAPACPSWCVDADDAKHWHLGYEASHRRDFGDHVRVYVGEAVYGPHDRETYPPVVVIDHHRVEMEGESLYEADDALKIAHQMLLAASFARHPSGWDDRPPSGSDN